GSRKPLTAPRHACCAKSAGKRLSHMAAGGLCLALALGSAAQPSSQAFLLPDTPDGLKPTQSWDAVGSTPSGDIFVAGMDHVTNAALYRFRPATGGLEYVGDARAASESANNWLTDEAVQKFHTRPLWHHGCVYVSTLNWSILTSGYLGARSLKWYA